MPGGVDTKKCRVYNYVTEIKEVFGMGIMLSDDSKIGALNCIQSSITVTDDIVRGVYMCDCTGCSNGCFETCADGQGPTD